MRILVITNVFPNPQAPITGPGIRAQLLAMRSLCDIEVMATIPWFPGVSRLRKYSPHGDPKYIPRTGSLEGIPVQYPRTLYIPRVGLGLAGPLYAASLFPRIMGYRGKVDAVFGAWAYPDGWAAIALAELLGVPAVIKMIGSDINSIAMQRGARGMLRWMLPRAAAIATVSGDLRRKTIEIGAAPDRVHVVCNGVDRDVFCLRDRAVARAELGIPADAQLIAYVGNLLVPKGVVDLFDAFERLAAKHPKAHLVLVGRGPQQVPLQARADKLGGNRVTFTGPLPATGVAQWMTACDTLCLPSWAEGAPNVINEAFACGRRVVASDVGGIPDLITSDTLGEMVRPRDIDGLTAALARAIQTDYDPEVVTVEGRPCDWNESAARMHSLLEGAVAERNGAGHTAAAR